MTPRIWLRRVVQQARSCGSLRNVGDNDGFSLPEVAIALMLGACAVSVATRVLLSAWAAAAHLRTELEARANVAALEQSLSLDVHGSVQMAVASGALRITLASGDAYRYFLNEAHEVVRVGLYSGGSAVLARGISSLVFTVVAGQSVTATGTMLGGEPFQLTLAGLEEVLHP